MEPTGGDLRQGYEYKGAFRDARVGNDQVGFVKNQLAIGKNIDIDDARAVLKGGLAAQTSFDLFNKRSSIDEG